MNYFFDSSAIIEMINRPEGQYNYAGSIITNALHLGEVYFYFLREHNKQTADFWMRQLPCELLEVNQQMSIEAAVFKFQNKKIPFSYIDCIGYTTALQHNLVFLTKDNDFANFANVEFVS